MDSLTVEKKIRMRASVNEWISENFPVYRKYLCHWDPQYNEVEGAWSITVGTKNLNGHSLKLGDITVNGEARIIKSDIAHDITDRIENLLSECNLSKRYPNEISGEGYSFHFGDGVEGANKFDTHQIDLLLTDPPYGISKSYICEQQVPRRLRKDGRDFIMPKGNFGEWDYAIKPKEWTDVLLPKVGGWFLTFCGQSQIKEYQDCLERHKFVAIGAMVWQKTNPVPFNHKFKPINAWEAMVVGKRPGTKFNGSVVHNVFCCKSPSPQSRIHSTQKPMSLIKTFIDLFSDQDDLIYDPFGGSATTLIAAIAKGRKASSYERDFQIYQSACHRIKENLQGDLL